MGTFYASTSGIGSGAGGIGAPWSATYAESQVVPGDTVFFRGGTYDFSFTLNLQGTSWSNAIRFATYPGETVIIKATSGEYLINYQSDQRWIEFDGLNLDATDAGTMYGAPVKIEGWSGGNAHHIRIKNAYVLLGSDGIPDQGVAGGPIGVICSAAAAGIVGFNEFIDLVISGGGDSGDFSYCFYIQSSNNLIQRVEMSDNSGAGVQVYVYDVVTAGPPTNNVIDSCFIHDQTRSPDVRIWGVIAGPSTNTIIKNTRFARIGGSSGGSVYLYTGSTKVYQCSAYDGDTVGYYVDAGSVGSTLQNNISFQNAGGNYYNVGSGTYQHANIGFLAVTNPLWTDPDNDDYTLQAGSPAISTGDDLAEVTVDALGAARTIGIYDLGALNFAAVAAGETLHLTAETGSDVWGVNTAGVFSSHPADVGLARYWDDPATGYAAVSAGGAAIPHWTAGLMAHPAMDFDGGDQFDIRNDADTITPAASAFLGVSTKTALLAFRVRSVTGTSATPYVNELIIADPLLNFGVFLRNNAGSYYVQAYNFDGNADSIELPIALNTPYVLMVRHTGGTLYASLNGGAESSTASGTTDTLAAGLVLGFNAYAALGFDGQLGEIRLRNDALTGTDLSTAITAMVVTWVTPQVFLHRPNPRPRQAVVVSNTW